MDLKKMQYDPKYSSVKWDFVAYFKPGKLQTLGAKDCAFKVRDSSGKPNVGPGKLGFLESKYKEPHKIKTFDFAKYSDGVTTASEDDTSDIRKKFNPKHIDFRDDNSDEINPIQTDTTDSKYIFDNQDAIVVNLRKKKKE